MPTLRHRLTAAVRVLLPGDLLPSPRQHERRQRLMRMSLDSPVLRLAKASEVASTVAA